MPERASERAPAGTVLVVDDDPLVLRTFRRILADKYTVELCVSASDAISRMAQGGIDVVVTDLSMPVLSGIDLLRLLRARNPDVPVVLVTGSPTDESEAEAAALGAFDYMVKPIGPEALLCTVDRALRRRIALAHG